MGELADEIQRLRINCFRISAVAVATILEEKWFGLDGVLQEVSRPQRVVYVILQKLPILKPAKIATQAATPYQ